LFRNLSGSETLVIELTDLLSADNARLAILRTALTPLLGPDYRRDLLNLLNLLRSFFNKVPLYRVLAYINFFLNLSVIVVTNLVLVDARLSLTHRR